ncbi:MAG: DUF4876 domain-containing protein [Prevotellaceae bacterium]|nr:DUF4876 domain-containing protein [Prevotellaceae bacterium]MDY6131093.1 DUF4876 domain-containing protein [Prevotella sp.]
MNKRIFKNGLPKTFVFFAALGIVMVSCNEYKEDNIEIKNVSYRLSLNMPLNMQDATLLEGKAVMTNIHTQRQYTVEGFTPSDNGFAADMSLPEGNYNIAVKGIINYLLNKQKIEAKVKAKRENIAIYTAAHQAATKIALNVYSAQEGFVISEIFFTGTTTPDGFMYTDDQYIKIGNNSDTTMYADGIAFIESFFTSDDKHDYQPDIMSEAMTIVTIYVVPGTGHDVPVRPGEELVIALTAIDHRPINPNSFDLSKADFEIYDKCSHPEGDQDNPKIPNLVNWYANFEGTFVMHTRGVKSYALARPMVDMKTYMTNYRYKFGYTFLQGDIVVPMNEREYFMPNAWIIDAVNLAVPTVHEWNLVSPMLDKGFTYCGQVDFDETRYNKSVIRKKEGRKWIDTNNSTEDFIPNAIPSYLRKP